MWLSVINQNVVLETASVAGTNTEEIRSVFGPIFFTAMAPQWCKIQSQN